MVRPKKEYKVQRNGDSLQFFHNGVLKGSLSLRLLCVLASDEELKHTVTQSTQRSFIKEGVSDEG